MEDLERNKESKFIKDKCMTIVFFNTYTAILLITSYLISIGKTSGYIFGVFLAITLAMILFTPNIRKKDTKRLIIVAILFTIYPIAYKFRLYKIILILSYSSFLIKFNAYINRKYLNKNR